MKVVMLKGPGSCGKTTVLNRVYCCLTTIHGAVVHTAKKTLDSKSCDFEAILDYCGKKVALFTMGDISYMVIDAMIKYDNLGVDVLIIACNDKFIKPFKAVEQYQHHTVEKKKHPPASRDGDDKKVTDKIISNLNRLLEDT